MTIVTYFHLQWKYFIHWLHIAYFLTKSNPFDEKPFGGSIAPATIELFQG